MTTVPDPAAVPGASGEATVPPPWLEELPPRQIVAELDRYIVGQAVAKRAVAIAVRNRWRRSQAPDPIRDEITPYNIILSGATGVGKTEVARRLARLGDDRYERVGIWKVSMEDKDAKLLAEFDNRPEYDISDRAWSPKSPDTNLEGMVRRWFNQGFFCNFGYRDCLVYSNEIGIGNPWVEFEN